MGTVRPRAAVGCGARAKVEPTPTGLRSLQKLACERLGPWGKESQGVREVSPQRPARQERVLVPEEEGMDKSTNRASIYKGQPTAR